MKLDHTPGPWKWFETKMGEAHVNPVVGGLLVASCSVRNPFDPEQLANARLIAAAPDMLEGLIYSYKMMCKYCNAVESYCKGQYSCNEKTKRAKLIESATGKKIEEVVGWNDGLFDAGCCACKKEDLMPCGEMTPNCEPGYIQKCTSECDYFNELTGRCCEEWDYCINKNKPGESV